jgi:tRNA threonylcarbamoyladenosine biosynthesis protein TsaB
MILLAIDTSSVSGSIALASANENLTDFKIIYQQYLSINITHSETLLPEIDNAFKKNKLDINQLSAVLVSIGPGSFTGIRIGLATAKGICTGLKIPLIPFNTLELLATNVYGTERQILSLIDARMNEAYISIYNHNLSIELPAELRPYDQICKDLNEKYLCVGHTHLITNNNDNFAFALAHQNIINASSMFSLLIYHNLPIEYNPEIINNTEPTYIRNSTN